MNAFRPLSFSFLHGSNEKKKNHVHQGFCWTECTCRYSPRHLHEVHAFKQIQNMGAHKMLSMVQVIAICVIIGGYVEEGIMLRKHSIFYREPSTTIASNTATNSVNEILSELLINNNTNAFEKQQLSPFQSLFHKLGSTPITTNTELETKPTGSLHDRLQLKDFIRIPPINKEHHRVEPKPEDITATAIYDEETTMYQSSPDGSSTEYPCLLQKQSPTVQQLLNQLVEALRPVAAVGELHDIVSQIEANNPQPSNDPPATNLPGQLWQSFTSQIFSSNGALNWNAVNKIPVIGNWIGSNSVTSKPSKPTIACPTCQATCGMVNTIQSRKRRIIGGTVVDPPNKYPWTTRFVYFNADAGQGTLINDRAIITTATIALGMPLFSQAFVMFGVYDTHSTTEERIAKNISKVVPHPDFDTGSIYNNNLGIVITDGPVAFSSIVQPICLPMSFDSYGGTQAVVAGWGANSIGGHMSPIPHEATIPLYTQYECQLANPNLTSNNLCGGYVQPAQTHVIESTCEGDEGAALMAPSRSNPAVLTLIGIDIQSPGEGCGNTNQPAVFTNIQHYIDFILYYGLGCGC